MSDSLVMYVTLLASRLLNWFFYDPGCAYLGHLYSFIDFALHFIFDLDNFFFDLGDLFFESTFNPSNVLISLQLNDRDF